MQYRASSTWVFFWPGNWMGLDRGLQLGTAKQGARFNRSSSGSSILFSSSLLVSSRSSPIWITAALEVAACSIISASLAWGVRTVLRTCLRILPAKFRCHPSSWHACGSSPLRLPYPLSWRQVSEDPFGNFSELFSARSCTTMQMAQRSPT